MSQDFFKILFYKTNLKEVLRKFYNGKIHKLNNIRQEYYYYDARYDYYFILKDLNDDEIDELIRKAKENFIKVNSFYDKEVFLLDSGLSLFVDNLNDHIDSFKRGKCYLIDKSEKYFIHHFELVYNVTTGKTIIFSTKKLPQLIFYLKKILNRIDLIINEVEVQIEQKTKKNIEQEIKSFKIEQYDKLAQFRKALIDGGFIDKETKIGDFKKVFDYKFIPNKIIWKKAFTHLNYLITTLYDEGIIINDKDKKWVITANCFVVKKGEELIEFNSEKIRTANGKSSSAVSKIYDTLKASKLL